MNRFYFIKYFSISHYFQNFKNFNVKISRSRGFGFVAYSQMSMVQLAMSNLPHIIDGHEVQSNIAQFPSVWNLHIFSLKYFYIIKQ